MECHVQIKQRKISTNSNKISVMLPNSEQESRIKHLAKCLANYDFNFHATTYEEKQTWNVTCNVQVVHATEQNNNIRDEKSTPNNSK